MTGVRIYNLSFYELLPEYVIFDIIQEKNAKQKNQQALELEHEFTDFRFRRLIPSIAC